MKSFRQNNSRWFFFDTTNNSSAPRINNTASILSLESEKDLSNINLWHNGTEETGQWSCATCPRPVLVITTEKLFSIILYLCDNSDMASDSTTVCCVKKKKRKKSRKFVASWWFVRSQDPKDDQDYHDQKSAVYDFSGCEGDRQSLKMGNLSQSQLRCSADRDERL